MRITLVVTGEVQVNIRLFISFESKESLKWNVKTIFDQRCATFRAVFIRHIPSTASGIRTHFIRIKITVMTIRAVIMRA